MSSTHGWIAPTLALQCRLCSLTDLGEFGLVLIFSGWVTCGHRIPSLCLCCCVYTMQKIILPVLIGRTGDQAHTALRYLCLCHPRLALNSNPLSSVSECWMSGVGHHACLVPLALLQDWWPLPSLMQMCAKKIPNPSYSSP